MTNHTTLHTLKKCALCHKEQTLKEFIALSGTHNLLDICRTCQANDDNEGDGGGGLQLNNINQQYTVLLDEKMQLQEKEETQAELEEQFFQDKDLAQKQQTEEHTHEQNKALEAALEDSVVTPPANTIENNPTLARYVALQNTNVIFRTQEKLNQTTAQTKQQQTQSAHVTKSWFMQKNIADQPQKIDRNTLAAKETTQPKSSTLFKATQEQSVTEKAATERANTFLNKTFGPGKKH